MSYWQDGRLVLHHYRSGERLTASPLVVDLLDAFSTWQPLAQASTRIPNADPEQLSVLVEALVEAGLLERSDRVAAAPQPADGWDAWNPAAGFFHGATRDVRFWPRDDSNAFLSRKAGVVPPPPPVTRSAVEGAATLALPAPSLDGELPRALRARRTWRRFAKTPITTAELATLTGLTWGVQAWVDVPRFGRIPLKTAPSGGARHAIEAYALVRRVAGVPAGLYHYDSSAHALTWRRRPATAAAIARFVPHQTWMAEAAAIVFMTAVFARVQWRYPFARAYRTVLAEAGHHAQTFCLLATALQLAPFCTMALGDTAIERALGLDGVHEAVLYAVGVGARPRGVTWAPWPGPRATPPRHDIVPGDGRRPSR